MKRKKTKVYTIGLLASSLYDQYQNAIWAGIQNQASVQGARVLCFAGGALEHPDTSHLSRNPLYSLISPDNVDALIIISGSVGVYTGKKGIKKLLKQCPGIPAVSIGIDIPGISSIVVDNEQGMRNLVFHMIEIHKCKKIAFIKGPESNDEANARFNAYKQTLAEYNLPFDPNLIYQGNFEDDTGPNAVHFLIDKKHATFDALIGADDRSVLYSIDPLKQRGFKIPEDIKLAGFDDVINSQCSFPPLTTVRQPLFELGSLGLKNALDLIKGKSVPHIQMMPTNLIIRSSCGCSPGEIVPLEATSFKLKKSKKVPVKNITASILSELEETFSLSLYRSESEELSPKIQALVNLIIDSIKKSLSKDRLITLLKETVITFYNQQLTFSLWKGILASIFQKLQRYFSSDKERSVLNSFWNESLITLYQAELHLQAHNKINFFREIELLERVGDQSIACFHLDEIKRILLQSLPLLNINECYISIYEKERTKARLIFNLDTIHSHFKQKTIFPSHYLMPEGLPPDRKTSYCIQPLVSEHDQFGFTLFELSGTNGYLYEILAEKIAHAINGAKLAEEIKRQNIALRESESEDLRITLNSIGDAVIATDSELRITRMNPMAEELTGWPITTVLGYSLLNVFHIADTASKNDVKKSLTKILKKGQVVGAAKHIVLVSKDGTEHQINYSGAPIHNVDGMIVGTVLVFRDITEQNRMEEQLRQSQKMDSIGQLAGGVAHDFNNMLVGISGSAELIYDRAGTNKTVKKFAGIILDAAEKASDLTQKLLAFSRKAKVQSTIVNVHTCITQAMQILTHSIDRRIKIRSEFKAGIPTITGDPAQIQNLVLNLGVNARDAMPDGGELTITTANVTLDEEYCRNSLFDTEPGPHVEICVHDTGTGMSRETQERIYDPFFTTKDIGKGTGLGLAAVYGIARDHHGSIQIHSELEKGTLFKVYFPVKESAIKPEKSDVQEIQTGSGCILVVDDENIVRKTLEGLLNDLGYDVLFAKDGEEGLKIYKKEQKNIDLVILDMVMPKMNGRDAFKAMQDINPKVKILFSSGFSKDTDMDNLLEQGAVGFIQKPFRRVELSRTLVKSLKT